MPAQDQDDKHDDHDDHDCSEADKHGLLLWLLGEEGCRIRLSRAGGAGWRGLAALLTRTGIRRVTYLLKASLTLPKAGMMLPAASPAVF